MTDHLAAYRHRRRLSRQLRDLPTADVRAFACMAADLANAATHLGKDGIADAAHEARQVATAVLILRGAPLLGG